LNKSENSGHENRFAGFITTILVGMLLVSCGTEQAIRPGDTLDEAFNKAMTMYNEKDYSQAISAFETVISIGRGTDTGREAQFLLAESYFKNNQYLMAASEYQRFTTLYPQAENVRNAEFKRALCYYHLSPKYNLSQKHTRQAIDLFELYISRYPDSDKVAQASDYIDQLRVKLARKMFEAAKLYQRVDEYEAAALYYGMTTEQYPETKWAEEAQVDQIFAYIQFARRSVQDMKAKRYQKAIDSYEEYLQLFPEGDSRQEAEQYLNIAENELAQIDGSTESTQQQNLTEKKQPGSDNS
jgi:outer membrane protein assembly factor BamD